MAKDVGLLAKAGVYFRQHDVSVQNEKKEYRMIETQTTGSGVLSILCDIGRNVKFSNQHPLLRHRAYAYTTLWFRIIQFFPLTKYTTQYGRP